MKNQPPETALGSAIGEQGGPPAFYTFRFSLCCFRFSCTVQLSLHKGLQDGTVLLLTGQLPPAPSTSTSTGPP
jgi:hypothetical protein